MRANTAQERLNTRVNQLSAAVPPMPLDAQLHGSKLTWVEPADTSYITHYLIRVGSDAAAPTYVVPVGSTACNLANGDSEFWLSSGNANMETESPMAHVAGSVDLISALADVQPISGAAFLQDSVTGDSAVLTYVGRYNPPAEASGFTGVVAYWEIPSSPTGKFVFAGEADYDGVITATDSTRYGTFRLRAALPAVATTWGLRLVPKGASWRGSVSTSSPVVTFAVPAAAQADAGNNAIDNASFEFGLSRWFGFSAGVTTDATISKLPSNSLKVTATTTQAVYQPEFAATGNADVLPCVPGDRLEFSGFYQFAASSANTVGKARIVCYDSAGAEVGSADTAAYDPAVVAWGAFSLSLTAPAGSAYMRFVAFEGALTSGTLYIDALLGRVSGQGTEPNKTPLDYGAIGDGSTDDTVAVVACAAANVSWEVPGGYTFLMDPLILTSMPIVRITGAGTLKKRTGSSGDVVLVFDNCASVRLSQIGIDANGADYCVRLGGTTGSEGWLESCDLSDFAVAPLDVDFTGGSDYYAYNCSQLSDRLNWIAAARPSALSVTVSALSDSIDQYSVTVATTMPGGTDPEQMVGFEYQGVFFDDAALTTPTGGYVQVLGMVADGGITFGPYPRTDVDAWIKPRVRSYNALGRYSAWRDAGAAAKIDRIPPPPGPAEVACSLSSDPTTYSFGIVWPAPVADPAKSVAVGVERRAFFWYNELGTGTPDEVGLGYEPSLDINAAVDGPFDLPLDYEAWAKVGVRALNYRGVGSDWVYTQGLMKIGMASGVSSEGGLGDITIQSAGAVQWGDYATSGEVYVDIVYSPYYTGSGASRSTVHRSVNIYIERNVDGKAVPEGRGFAPYDFAHANEAPPANWGTFRCAWKPAAEDVWIQGCAVGESRSLAWKSASSTPALAPASRWHKYTITQGDIDSHGAVMVADAPNAVSVTALPITGKHKDGAGEDCWAVAGIVTWPTTGRSLIRRPKLQLNEVGSSNAPIILLPHFAELVAGATTEYSTELTNPRPSKDTQYTVSVLVENADGKVTATPTTSAEFTVKPIDASLPDITDFAAVRTTPIVFGPTGAETYQLDYVGTWPDDADFDYGQIWVEVVEDPDDDYRGLVGETQHGGTDRGYSFVGRTDQWPMWGYAFTVRIRAMAYNMAGVATEVGFDTVDITPGSAMGGGMDFSYNSALSKWQIAVKVGKGNVINPTTGTVDSTAGGLRNGGFESGLADWSVQGGVTVDTAVVASGAYAARLTGGSADTAVFQEVLIQPGKSYRVSVNVYNACTGGAATSPRIVVSWMDKVGAVISQSNSNTAIAANSAWTMVSHVFTVPTGAVRANLYPLVVFAGTGGYAVIDSVAMDEVTSVAASATAPAGLACTLYETAADANGIKQWFLLAVWTGETETAERTKISFAFSRADSLWSPTEAATPLGSFRISQNGVNLAPQPFQAAGSNALLYCFIESKDGKLAQCAALHFVIPAGPTGGLNPLMLDASKMDGMSFAGGKFQVTQDGVMARIALGDMLGLVDNQLAVILRSDAVLTTLLAVSGGVIISNTHGTSITLSASDASLTMTNGNCTITMSPAGGLTIARGGNNISIDSLSISFNVGAGTPVSITGSGSNGLSYNDLSNRPSFGNAALKNVGYGTGDVAGGYHEHYNGNGITGNWSGTIHGRDGQEITVVNGLATAEHYSS